MRHHPTPPEMDELERALRDAFDETAANAPQALERLEALAETIPGSVDASASLSPRGLDLFWRSLVPLGATVALVWLLVSSLITLPPVDPNSDGAVASMDVTVQPDLAEEPVQLEIEMSLLLQEVDGMPSYGDSMGAEWMASEAEYGDMMGLLHVPDNDYEVSVVLAAMDDENKF